MATKDQVKALVRSHADRDDDRFFAIAMQMAAQAARSGHTKFAQELRDLVDQAKVKLNETSAINRTKPVPVVQPRGELAGLLTAQYPKLRLSDMVLAEDIRRRIEQILIEQRQRHKIREHGLHPQRKLLLIGLPGTGKTMTAAVLAGELGLPLFTIQLDGLITKFLGETAAKLRLIFDTITQTRAVYLFDEFDALGGERGSKNDVGEIRRVLSSFLQFLEHDDSESLIVAATNHPSLLDKALFRRFDSVIEYSLPTPSLTREVMQTRLAMFDTSQMDWEAVIKAAEGLSHAEIAKSCELAAKKTILNHTLLIDTNTILHSLSERQAIDR